MSRNSIISLTVISAVVLTSLSLFLSTVTAQEKPQFICGDSYDAESGKRLPTTFVWTSRGKIALIRWQTEHFGNYPPQRRCQEVFPRFQEAYDNGSINLITNGRINNQPVICTARAYGEECKTLLMTLRHEDNPGEILNQLKAIFQGQQVGPVKHSAGEMQFYYNINFEEFLRTAPVEPE